MLALGWHPIEVPGGESDLYVLQAEQLLRGGLPNDQWHPVYYPMLIAAMTGLTGDVFAAARLVSAVCGGILVFAAATLARRLFGAPAAWLAGTLLAVLARCAAVRAPSSRSGRTGGCSADDPRRQQPTSAAALCARLRIVRARPARYAARMVLTRKIGSFLRGKATRGQVFAAALLAGLLGFVPGFFLRGDLGGGFMQAPGLILSLFFLVLVLNANLGVFGLVTLLAKLVSYLTLPVAYWIGEVLLDGPTQGLFKPLVNGPVTAWFGLHYYATAGGLVLGALFGAGAGVLLVQALTRFRQRMAGLEQHSDRYQAASQKKSLRFLTWLLFGKGKGGKVSWQELAEGQQRALPVRLWGVVSVVVIAGGLFVFQRFFSTPLLTSGVQSGLLAVNGATVDLKSAELDLAGGSLRFTDLALADASALDKNLFAASALEARIDTGALLRRRFVIDRLLASNAATGQRRGTPGQLVQKPPPPPPPPAGQKTIDDYLKDVELWRARLQQARDWIAKLTGSGQTAPARRTPAEVKQQRETDLRTLGYAHVAADQLLEDLPAVLIRAIDIEGIASAELGEPVDLHVTNFSTNAWLLGEPPRITLKTKSDRLALQLTGPSKERPGAGIELGIKSIPVDAVFAQFKLAGAPPLRGGAIDLQTTGSLLTRADQETTCELPLQVTLRDTTFALAGHKETKVERLLLPVAVSGPVTRPAIALQDKALADALVAAGKQELAGFVSSQAGKLLGGVPGAGDVLDPNKSPQQVLDDAAKKAEEAAKKAAADAAAKAAEEAARKGLRGLLPGGKKQ